MSNFSFLANIKPELSQLGSSAELYCHDDKQAALVKLRCFTELLVGDIYSRLSLTSPERDDLYNRLRSDEFRDAVSDKGIWAKLDLLRRKGNDAAHPTSGSVNTSINELFWLIKEAYLVARWYAQAILNQPITPPEFVDPVKPIDHTSRLEAELIRQREELNKREAALKEQLVVSQQTLEQQTSELLAELSVKNDTLSNAKKEQTLLQIELEQKQRDLIDFESVVSDYRSREAFKQASISSASSFELDMEVTRRNIDIFDCFENVTLTTEQSQIVKQVNEFLKDTSQNVFLLNGYAGTGKTFMTKGITQYLEKIGREFTIMAPTGKAAKVISDKTMQTACTIHRVIYNYDNVKEFNVDGVEGSETYRCYAELEVNVDTAEAVYIIDEASMVSDKYSDGEFFRFGTGYLLKDLLKYINIDHNDHNKKIIFIGDNAQLPPVGMNTSPALDAKYLHENYQVAVISGYLTEVVRQKGESGVLTNAAILRDGLEKNVFNQLQFEVNNRDVFQLTSNDLLKTFLDSCDGKISRTGESVIIAYSNRQVAEYNRLVREHFFKGQEEMVKGDKIISVANHYLADASITNGEFGMIREVLSPVAESVSVVISTKGDNGQMVKRKVDLRFRDVILGFRDDYGKPFFFQAKVIENLLYGDQSALSSDEHKALYVHFLNRNPDLKRKGNKQKLKVALLQDPYFNAFKIKFGYAITGHKAQGSEWKNVFLQCKTHQKTLTKDYFRWIYTAITRTTSKLYVLNPPNKRLGEKPEVVDNGWFDGDVQPATQPQVPVMESDNAFGILESQHILKDLLRKVQGQIANTGIEITDIHHYQYQELYVFKAEDNFAEVQFYTSKKKVSSVTVQGNGLLQITLQQLLMPLQGEVLSTVGDSTTVSEYSFEEDYLEQFHDRVVEVFSGEGLVVSELVQNPWTQRYTLSQNGDTAVIDFYYNGKKQFNKIAPEPNLSSSKALLKQAVEIWRNA